MMLFFNNNEMKQLSAIL